MRRAGCALLLVLVAACSSSGGHATTSSSATTTTTATTVAPTTTTVPLQPQDTAVHAVSAFVQAWREGDQATAATVATAGAVQSAFAAGIPTSLSDRGCMSGDVDPIACVYASDLGEVQVRATHDGDGWIVDQVEVTPA